MRVFLIALAVTAFSTASYAMDEFGARFGSDAPTALTDTVDESMETKSPEEALSEIAPAAGDEDAAAPSSDEVEAETLEKPPKSTAEGASATE